MEQVLAASATLAAAHPQLSEAQLGALNDIVEAYASSPEVAPSFFSQWDKEEADGEGGQESRIARARAFLDGIVAFGATYPGGIKSYVSKARVLLEQSRTEYVIFVGGLAVDIIVAFSQLLCHLS